MLAGNVGIYEILNSTKLCAVASIPTVQWNVIEEND